MNANAQMLERLTSSEVFRNYGRAYTEVTGMSLALRPVETWQLPFQGRRSENGWCALMGGQSRTCAACLRMQDKLAHSATDGPVTLTCTFGLCETAVPIKLGPQTVGLLQTGQVMRRRPSEAGFRRALRQARALGVNLSRAEAKAAYFATPVVSPAKLAAASGLLAVFADHLSMKSNQIAAQSSQAEPPIVARARQFIREHHAEDLSLGQVAAAVNASLFYFCKLFRKVTGLTFTEFVARTRIERAKELLLDRNVRVSEVAYAVGFQSLTHFNRVFKKLVGMAPKQFRAQSARV